MSVLVLWSFVSYSSRPQKWSSNASNPQSLIHVIFYSLILNFAYIYCLNSMHSLFARRRFYLACTLRALTAPLLFCTGHQHYSQIWYGSILCSCYRHSLHIARPYSLRIEGTLVNIRFPCRFLTGEFTCIEPSEKSSWSTNSDSSDDPELSDSGLSSFGSSLMIWWQVLQILGGGDLLIGCQQALQFGSFSSTLPQCIQAIKTNFIWSGLNDSGASSTIQFKSGVLSIIEIRIIVNTII